MTSLRALPAAVVFLALMSLQPGSDSVHAAQAGRIDSIVPAAAAPDERVTIRGNGFGGPNVRITVGGVPAQVVSASGNTAVFLVPRGATAGLSTVTAKNPGGQQHSIAFRVLLGFALSAGAAQTAVIGPDGGFVTAQSNGTSYRLDIPPAALDQNTQITVTPIASIANLPFSNGVAAAAHFEPSGLQLHRPGTLTISRPAGGFPSGLLGFLVDDQGMALEVLGMAAGATQVVVPVTHFSAAGGGAPTLADFERQVLPLLASLPPSLPPTQVRTLIQLLVAWVQGYGFSMCGQTNLCTTVFALAQQSLDVNRTQVCADATAFIRQGEPFLAQSGIAAFIKVAVNLAEITDLADQLNEPGYSQPFDITCALTALQDLVDLAEQQALANPRGGLLTLIADVGADAALLEETVLADYAFATLKRTIDTISTRAMQICPQDSIRGDALLDVILTHFTDSFLDGLDPGSDDELHDLRAGCPIQIVPALPTVGFDGQQAFSATTHNLSPGGVTWSIDGPALGSTIDSQSGLFTAARNAGTVTVKATSIADSSRFKRVPVHVVQLIQITITPATAVLSPGGVATFTAQVQGAGPLVAWFATGGVITPGPSGSAVFTAGSTAGTFHIDAVSVDDQTQFQTVPITIVSTATHLAGTITLVAHWDEAIPTFREVVDVSMSASATVDMATDSQGRQFIPQAFAPAAGTITGRAVQNRDCGTELDTFTGGNVVGATAFFNAPLTTTPARLRFSVNGVDNRSIPESCGGQSISIPQTGLGNLYSVPLQIEGTVLRSADGRTILGVDFNRTVLIDLVDGAVGGMTITITGALTPVP